MIDNDQALPLVLARNQFYRRQYFFALGILALNILVVVFLIGVLMFLKRNPTHPVYFATDDVGRLIQVVPVSEPNMKLDDVMAWAQEAVEKTYSYDYVNYRSEMQNAAKYFTDSGWSDYLSALTASNNLIALNEDRLVFVAQVVSKPKLLASGILQGSYAYKFEIPVLVTYLKPPYDEKSRFTNALTVSLVIQRQPILQSYKGLGIMQFVAFFSPRPTGPHELSDQSS